jgi:hypothetical protein
MKLLLLVESNQKNVEKEVKEVVLLKLENHGVKVILLSQPGQEAAAKPDKSFVTDWKFFSNPF